MPVTLRADTPYSNTSVRLSVRCTTLLAGPERGRRGQCAAPPEPTGRGGRRRARGRGGGALSPCRGTSRPLPVLFAAGVLHQAAHSSGGLLAAEGAHPPLAAARSRDPGARQGGAFGFVTVCVAWGPAGTRATVRQHSYCPGSAPERRRRMRSVRKGEKCPAYRSWMSGRRQSRPVTRPRHKGVPQRHVHADTDASSSLNSA